MMESMSVMVRLCREDWVTFSPFLLLNGEWVLVYCMATQSMALNTTQQRIRESHHSA